MRCEARGRPRDDSVGTGLLLCRDGDGQVCRGPEMATPQVRDEDGARADDWLLSAEIAQVKRQIRKMDAAGEG